LKNVRKRLSSRFFIGKQCKAQIKKLSKTANKKRERLGSIDMGILLKFGAENLVELSGIEPLTSCMPCKRSPS
jgi:hypothetical protein